MRREWIDVTLDSGSRRGAAEAVATYAARNANGEDSEPLKHLRRMLGSSRSELPLDADQARLLLAALEVDDRMSALRARLQAFLEHG
jgi:hypothetical protein